MNSTSLIHLFVLLLAGFVVSQTISRIPPLPHTPLMANAIPGISLVASSKVSIERASKIGEHNAQILEKLKFDAREIEKLRASETAPHLAARAGQPARRSWSW
jgi:crotonobetainyl-CoA:carnitine CoA-transferase CaiB-like acyl-CoA transferase